MIFLFHFFLFNFFLGFPFLFTFFKSLKYSKRNCVSKFSSEFYNFLCFSKIVRSFKNSSRSQKLFKVFEKCFYFQIFVHVFRECLCFENLFCIFKLFSVSKFYSRNPRNGPVFKKCFRFPKTFCQEMFTISKCAFQKALKFQKKSSCWKIAGLSGIIRLLNIFSQFSINVQKFSESVRIWRFHQFLNIETTICWHVISSSTY